MGSARRHHPHSSTARSIYDRERIDLNKVARRQRRHAEQHVRRLMFAEQCLPGFFDNGQTFVAIVIDDINGEGSHAVFFEAP